MSGVGPNTFVGWVAVVIRLVEFHGLHFVSRPVVVRRCFGGAAYKVGSHLPGACSLAGLRGPHALHLLQQVFSLLRSEGPSGRELLYYCFRLSLVDLPGLVEARDLIHLSLEPRVRSERSMVSKVNVMCFGDWHTVLHMCAVFFREKSFI